MQLPDELQSAIDSLIEAIPPSSLRKAREALSKNYCSAGSSSLMFRDEAMRLAYLSSRMPATYAAIHQVLRQIPYAPSSWLDLGAGPGTASWAAATLFPDSLKITLVEKSHEAIALGKRLALAHPILGKAEWLCGSSPTAIRSADAAIFSYSLGELDRPSEWIESWWKAGIPFLVIVEPGTPRGFSLIRKVRDQVLALGGFLVAPCPHSLPCPLKGDDWCHFSVRLQRSRLQRYLKGGSLGYEDEKYSYLIASRSPGFQRPGARILRHPQKHSGHVRLALCTSAGTAEEISVTRSNQKFYRQARDAVWGDSWSDSGECKTALQEDPLQ